MATNDSASLGMHPSEYQKQQAYFDGVVAAIDTGKRLLANNTTDNTPTRNSASSQVLLAQQPSQMPATSSALPLLAQ